MQAFHWVGLVKTKGTFVCGQITPVGFSSTKQDEFMIKSFFTKKRVYASFGRRMDWGNGDRTMNTYAACVRAKKDQPTTEPFFLWELVSRNELMSSRHGE